MNSTLRFGIACSVLCLALAHILGCTGVDLVALAYIGIAILIFLVDEFQELTFGKDGFSFKRRANRALENYGVGGKPTNTNIASNAPESIRELALRLDDPNKHQFGGRSIVHGKSMAATVRPFPGNRDWYFIRLSVESTEALHPLEGKVTFFLHPTFKTAVIEKSVTGGKATLETVAWGAFTVGAICHVDQTRLELDLSEIADAPIIFRSR